MTQDESPDALLRRANQLLASGQSSEAIEAHEQLLAVRPELPDSWFNLAWLQRGARRFEDALNSYAEALRLKVARPEEVHLNRAVQRASATIRRRMRRWSMP